MILWDEMLLEQWFLEAGVGYCCWLFFPRDIWQSVDTFLVVTAWVKESCYWHVVGRGKELEHLTNRVTFYRTLSSPKYPLCPNWEILVLSNRKLYFLKQEFKTLGFCLSFKYIYLIFIYYLTIYLILYLTIYSLRWIYYVWIYTFIQINIYLNMFKYI